MNPDVRYWHLAAIRLARSECPLLGGRADIAAASQNVRF
jgi:hypothetical protein